MKHIVVDELPPPGGTVELADDQSHYLLRVRRLSVGDSLACVDGRGSCAQAIVHSVDGDQPTVRLRIVRLMPSDAGTPASASRGPELVLYVPLLKGKRTEAILRQATELGVDRLVPMVSQHSVSRPTAGDVERKRTRWSDIVREATQQCGRPTLPAIASLFDVTTDIEAASTGVSVVFHQDAGSAFSPAELSARLASSMKRAPTLRVFVGPEGGFSSPEVDAFQQRGALLVRLPTPILRAETAAVAASSLVQLVRSEYTSSSAVVEGR